jgi:hypothetical protein
MRVYYVNKSASRIGRKSGNVIWLAQQSVLAKEVIKEQPTPRNLSATARRVLQCTRSLGLCKFTVAAPQKYFSAILAVQRQQIRKF